MRLRWDSVTASLGKPCLPRGSRSFNLAERLVEGTSKTVEESSYRWAFFIQRPAPGSACSGIEPDDLLAIGSDADQADWHADEVSDEAEIIARLLRQVSGVAAGGEVKLESRHLLVLRRRRMEDRLVVGEGVEHRPFLGAVADRDAQRADAAEDVELGDRQRIHAVEANRVAEGDEVHPATAPPPPGGRAELVATLQHLLTDVVEELGREGAGADPRRIGLGDPPDLVNVLRTDAGANASGSGDRVGGGDEGIGAVVQVEQSCLRPLED